MSEASSCICYSACAALKGGIERIENILFILRVIVKYTVILFVFLILILNKPNLLIDKRMLFKEMRKCWDKSTNNSLLKRKADSYILKLSLHL